MQRMSPLDASFLFLENDNQPMHIGGVAIFEGPAPSHEDVVHLLTSKLHLVPRYRQKVKFLPFSVGLPGWIDDPDFEIEYHIRRTALPAPGGQNELDNLVSRLIALQLDRRRPLWELWVIEGLEDGQWAILSKVHHCMIDGASGADLMSVIFDLSADQPLGDEQPWAPEPVPGKRATLAQTVRGAVRPVGNVGQTLRQLGEPRTLLRKSVETTYGLARMVPTAITTPENPLNGHVGPHRRWTSAEVSLADVKAARAGLGGTVNDIVLTAITLGFRDLLDARGELTEDATVRTMVPVSMRAGTDHGSHDNQVSALFVDLPVGLETPEEMLADIRRQMDTLKSSGSSGAMDRLVRSSRFVPPFLLAGVQRLAVNVPQRTLNTVTTNVPGPQRPLYVLGRKLISNAPWVPVATSMRATVAIFSYNGRISFGINGEYDAMPDLHVLRDGIAAGMAELVTRAQDATLEPAQPTVDRATSDEAPAA